MIDVLPKYNYSYMSAFMTTSVSHSFLDSCVLEFMYFFIILKKNYNKIL